MIGMQSASGQARLIFWKWRAADMRPQMFTHGKEKRSILEPKRSASIEPTALIHCIT